MSFTDCLYTGKGSNFDMTILADWQIKALAKEQELIEPFVDRVISEENHHLNV